MTHGTQKLAKQKTINTAVQRESNIIFIFILFCFVLLRTVTVAMAIAITRQPKYLCPLQ
jgi:hypothetical protein